MRKFLKGQVVDTSVETIARQRSAFELAYTLVRVYYGATLYLLVERLDQWSQGLALKEIFPLWPVAWVKLVGIPTAVHVIMTVFLIATLLSTLFPEKRIFRALLFVSLLEFVAFSKAFNNIGLTWNSWLGVGFFFIFLPDGKREQLQGSITKRQLYLTTFWAAQALVLGFYSLAGFGRSSWGIPALERRSACFRGRCPRLRDCPYLRPIGLPTDFPIYPQPSAGGLAPVSRSYLFTTLRVCGCVSAFTAGFWGISLIGFHLGSTLR